MSVRWVATLGAALAITAGAATIVERDRGFVPEARAITPMAPPAASASPGDHRAAVLALLGGDTSIEGLPRTSPAGAFVTVPDVPQSTSNPSAPSARPAAKSDVALADVAITGKSPASDERLAALLQDVRTCVVNRRAPLSKGGRVVFEKRAWKGRDDDLTLVAPTPYDALGGPNGEMVACVRRATRSLRFLALTDEVVIRGAVVFSKVD